MKRMEKIPFVFLKDLTPKQEQGNASVVWNSDGDIQDLGWM
jgi:hypothetical protein